MKQKIKKAIYGIIYRRVSSKEQLRGNSLAVQKEACFKYAKDNGIKVVRDFEEKGESAKVMDREELVKLLDYCQKNKGKIDVLIIWKSDRLARNVQDYYVIKAKLAQYGVSIHVVTEPVDNSALGEALEGVLAIFSQLDNRVKSDRSKSNMQKMIQNGIWPWAPPPGYMSLHNKKKDQKKTQPDPPHPKDFPLIQRALKEYLKGVYTEVDLTNMLNKWGYRTPRGRKIYPQFVDRMLRRIYYAGILIDPWTGEKYQVRHEKMITIEEWHKIQLIKQGKAFNAKPHLKYHPDFPLRNFARCPVCGGFLTGSWSKGRKERYAYYHCRNKNCLMYGKTVKKEKIHQDFIELLSQIKPKEGYLNAFKEVVIDLWQERYSFMTQERNRLERELDQLKSKKGNLIRMKAQKMNDQEFLSDEDFLGQKDWYDNQIAVKQVALNEAKIDELDIQSALDSCLQFIKQPARQWFDMALEQKQRFQKLVLTEGISYDRERGFGTAKLSFIYEANLKFQGEKSQLVPRVRVELTTSGLKGRYSAN